MRRNFNSERDFLYHVCWCLNYKKEIAICENLLNLHLLKKHSFLNGFVGKGLQPPVKGYNFRMVKKFVKIDDFALHFLSFAANIIIDNCELPPTFHCFSRFELGEVTDVIETLMKTIFIKC